MKLIANKQKLRIHHLKNLVLKELHNGLLQTKENDSQRGVKKKKVIKEEIQVRFWRFPEL